MFKDGRVSPRFVYMVTFAGSPPGRTEGTRSARVLLAALSDALFSGSGACSSLWSQLASTSPDVKHVGGMLALAGAFLFGSVRVSSSVQDYHLGDGGAFRGNSPCDKVSDEEHDRQRSVDDTVLASATWATTEARSACSECVRLWLLVLGSECRESGRTAVHTALMEALPDIASLFRKESAKLRLQDKGVRALAVALGLHWVAQQAHYTSFRDRFGLCVPPLLQVLEGCADPVVRLVALDAVHLMLDRAMAVEVQHLEPPLEHCFATSSPVFLDSDSLAPSTVVPYCSGHVLFLLKAYAPGDRRRQVTAEKFMRFGQVHCGTHSESFVLFLEFGLLPLLQRGPLILGTQLRQVMQVLLQAAESVSVREACMAWRGIHSVLVSGLGPRLLRYTMDLLLRASLGYLTFVASAPPPKLHIDVEIDEVSYRSPVVLSMTSAEWSFVVRHRAEFERTLAGVILALSSVSSTKVQELLLDLGDRLREQKQISGPDEKLRRAHLQNFLTFASRCCAAGSVDRNAAETTCSGLDTP